ncbi:uncharacterized protein LOC116959446 isoform X2 [Tyto alba]|uniref:uncharacterized protein LOC116959446 isoform X2 n=1 Tax=Tyto alba TaxID=56313 RepID=UPI001C674A86|nr:uncharacterized protein LOC116959446 isoform X2 [Tyto alba]
MSLSSIPVLQPESNLTAVPVGAGDAAWQLGSRTATAGDGTETDPEAVQESAFPGGSSGSRPASASAREAMQAPRMPVLSSLGERHHGRVYEFFQTNSGAVGETFRSFSRPQSSTTRFWTQNMERRCLIGTVVFVTLLPLALILWCVCIWRCRRRKEHAPAALGHELETGSCPSHPDNPTSHPGTPETQTQHKQLQPLTAKQAHLPSARAPLPLLHPSPSPNALKPQNLPSYPRRQPRHHTCPHVQLHRKGRMTHCNATDYRCGDRAPHPHLRGQPFHPPHEEGQSRCMSVHVALTAKPHEAPSTGSSPRPAAAVDMPTMSTRGGGRQEPRTGGSSDWHAQPP